MEAETTRDALIDRLDGTVFTTWVTTFPPPPITKFVFGILLT